MRVGSGLLWLLQKDLGFRNPEVGVFVYCFIRKVEGLGSSSLDRVGFEYSPEAGVFVYCFIGKEEGLGSSSFDWVGFEFRQCEPRTA